MSDDFLADVAVDGKKIEDIFDEKTSTEEVDEQEKETPAPSPEEKKPVEDEPPQEGENTPDENLPFHKHPRWKEMFQKAQRVDELEAEINDLREFREELERKQEESEKVNQPIPEWFTSSFGDNPDLWQKYLQYEEQKFRQIEEKVLNSQEQAKQKQTEEVNKWNTWVDQELQTLKEEGKKFDRNELLKVAIDFKPTDDKGNISIRKSFEIYESKKAMSEKPKSEAKKKIAANVTSEEGAEIEPKSYLTPADLRGKDFRDLINS